MPVLISIAILVAVLVLITILVTPASIIRIGVLSSILRIFSTRLIRVTCGSIIVSTLIITLLAIGVATLALRAALALVTSILVGVASPLLFTVALTTTGIAKPDKPGSMFHALLNYTAHTNAHPTATGPNAPNHSQAAICQATQSGGTDSKLKPPQITLRASNVHASSR